jgi:Fe-S oxidoreductase
MMAVRRWLTIQYDWTGLAKKFYLSKAWEFGALGTVALFVIFLFVFFHGPVITDHVSVNSFAPVFLVEMGDLLLAGVLSIFLLSNAFRMYRFIMNGTKVPFRLYLTEAKAFVLHFVTQKKWRECGEDKSRWLKHFLLVSGYLTMLTLIIVFLRWFQVDDSSWHFSSLFGYYATGVLLFVTVEMFLSRLKKQEMIHRYSHTSDWLFLVLLFLTTLTGIMMHLFRIGGWPMGTYVIYVIHLAIAVPMLVIEVPFGKWSHLFYRPFAVFLATVKEKALIPSVVDSKKIKTEVSEALTTCIHCGTCTTVCPTAEIADYSPRLILRHIALDRATTVGVDEASWSCVTCDSCTEHCPRGIGILDVIKSIRRQIVDAALLPKIFEKALANLKKTGNLWGSKREERLDWVGGLKIPSYDKNHEYCLFNCCTTAYDTSSHKRTEKAGLALLRLLNHGQVSYGTLGTKESCCGDMADKTGASDVAADLERKNTEMFLKAGVSKILTASPHCLNTFSKDYEGLKDVEKIHYTELLAKAIESGNILPTKSLDLKVTYHDPCYLGRHNNLYEEPRRILNSIPGLELVEMLNTRERSFCCGGGGGGIWRGNSTKESLGEIRIKEAMDTGATVIATACPYCIRMLGEAIDKLGVEDRIQVQDLAELLLQSVDLSDARDHEEPGTKRDIYN